MKNTYQSKSQDFRRSLRLTFQSSKGEIQLLSMERLDMICPPTIGERPQAGTNSGFWIELCDKKNKAIFHRLLDHPFHNAVTLHSPDGKIRRVLGEAEDHIFEVLLPDMPAAKSVVIIGENIDLKQSKNQKSQKRQQLISSEIVRFDLPKNEKQ